MALGLRRSASLLALLGRAEQVVDPGALRLLGRRVLGLTCLSATSVFLLPRLPEAVVMVLGFMPPCGRPFPPGTIAPNAIARGSRDITTTDVMISDIIYCFRV